MKESNILTELKEQLSKGLQGYLKLHQKQETIKVLSNASPEELEVILGALRSNNEMKRLEGAIDLNLLSYKKRVAHDKRILNAIEQLLSDEERNIRRKALETIGIILRAENEQYQKTMTTKFFEKISQVAACDDIELRERAFSVLEDTNDPGIIEVAFKAIREESEENWTRLCNNVIRCLHLFYHNDNYRVRITQRFYEMLDDSHLQTRASNTFAQVRLN